jgi:hypothetical protein
MNTKHLIFVVSALFIVVKSFGQAGEDGQNALIYKTEMFGSVASGNYTPFGW